MGSLSSGVIYGFLRDIAVLTEMFQTPHIAFTFDVGLPLRRTVFDGYKMRIGVAPTPEQKQARQELGVQIKALREEHLPKIGFRNIFHADGYEADDVIASICATHGGEKIIVSSDHDLYQLLDPHTRIWNPNGQKTVTIQSFIKDKGIPPSRWVEVKALIGEPATGDNIPGVVGVGEKTAIKFLLERLKPSDKKLHAIYRFMMDGGSYERNLKLVKLPFPDTPKFSIQKDEVDKKRWLEVVNSIGMESLNKLIPVCCRG